MASSGAPSWLTMKSGSSSGTGPQATYAVTANTGPAREGTLTIGGKTHKVTQESGCTFTVPASSYVSSSAGEGTVTISSSNGACQWTAAVSSGGTPWLTITPGYTSGTGTQVKYQVTANTGAGRSGMLTIGGNTHSVHQAQSYGYCASQCQAQFQACSAGGACVGDCIAAMCPTNPSVCGPYCVAMCSGQGGGTDCVAVYNQCMAGCN